MIEKTLKNNQALIAGQIVTDFEFSHEVFGEKFYFIMISVERLSSSTDTIPLLVSERLIDVSRSWIGRYIEAKGQFRSYNKHENNRNRLILSVFVRELEILDGVYTSIPNTVFLDGYICKEPVFRRTPLGREITDVLLAVNRAYSKSDYIPCICWGRTARYAAGMKVGSRIRIQGRIQSRVYRKKMDDDRVISRIAYEVSVTKLDLCEEAPGLLVQVADSGIKSS